MMHPRHSSQKSWPATADIQHIHTAEQHTRNHGKICYRIEETEESHSPAKLVSSRFPQRGCWIRIMVDLWNPKWRSLPWLWLGFVALALAVFTWGLGYKLSLYDPPQARSHEIPQAKLLSKNEQAIAVQSPLLEDAHDRSTALSRVLAEVETLLMVAIAAVAIPTIPAFRRRVFEMGAPRPLRHLAALPCFFFRPPPALA
jgi:hypothetical protein